MIEKNRGFFKSDQNRYSLTFPIPVFVLIFACCVLEDYFPALSAMPQIIRKERPVFVQLEADRAHPSLVVDAQQEVAV